MNINLKISDKEQKSTYTSGNFFTIKMHDGWTYNTGKRDARKLLLKLESFGHDCSEPCKLLRQILREKLEVSK